MKIDTKYQLADPGTKNLPYKEFKEKVMQFMTDFIQVVVDCSQWASDRVIAKTITIIKKKSNNTKRSIIYVKSKKKTRSS